MEEEEELGRILFYVLEKKFYKNRSSNVKNKNLERKSRQGRRHNMRHTFIIMISSIINCAGRPTKFSKEQSLMLMQDSITKKVLYDFGRFTLLDHRKNAE